jgi:hypothetical protein
MTSNKLICLLLLGGFENIKADTNLSCENCQHLKESSGRRL